MGLAQKSIVLNEEMSPEYYQEGLLAAHKILDQGIMENGLKIFIHDTEDSTNAISVILFWLALKKKS